MKPKDFQTQGTMAHAQRRAAMAALEDNNYNLSRAARQLRVGRNTLSRLINASAIEIDKAAQHARRQSKADHGAGAETRVMLREGSWYLVGAQENSRDLAGQ